MTVVALALGYTKTWAPMEARKPITNATAAPRPLKEVTRVAHH